MERKSLSPRDHWQQRVEAQGFHFHTLDDQPYWDESACYVFRNQEIETLERATYALNDMCLKAVEHVFANNLLATLQIPDRYHAWLHASWEREEHTFVGRFDLAMPHGGSPRLLEFNADTPTSLLEAAVIQWTWLKDTHPEHDQFNSLHERLIEAWRSVAGNLAEPVFFSSVRDSLEDFMTVNYLRDTAMQAGLETEYLAVENIAWNPSRRQFVDGKERHLGTIFKLYPWEWMLREEFGPNLVIADTRWFEPPWKMVLSNKGILPILWELYPDSPYLLRAEREPFGASYVRKPMLGREGANVSLVYDGRTLLETEGPYQGPFVYQDLCQLPDFEGNYAVLGSWLVNGYACGLGIREDTLPVTQNTSRFVPHLIER